MIEKKELTQAEWYQTHVLTSEQRKKLVEEKLERARQWHEAIKKREALLESC